MASQRACIHPVPLRLLAKVPPRLTNLGERVEHSCLELFERGRDLPAGGFEASYSRVSAAGWLADVVRVQETFA